jgi:hypothetical protein
MIEGIKKIVRRKGPKAWTFDVYVEGVAEPVKMSGAEVFSPTIVLKKVLSATGQALYLSEPHRPRQYHFAEWQYALGCLLRDEEGEGDGDGKQG